MLFSSPFRRAIETAAALQEVLIGDNEIILKVTRYGCGSRRVRVRFCNRRSSYVYVIGRNRRANPSLVEGGGLYTTDPKDGKHIALPGATPTELEEAYPDIILDVSELAEEGWWFGHCGRESDDGPKSDFHMRAVEVARWMKALRPPLRVEDVIIVCDGDLLDRVLCELLGLGPDFQHLRLAPGGSGPPPSTSIWAAGGLDHPPQDLTSTRGGGWTPTADAQASSPRGSLLDTARNPRMTRRSD
eukprot:6939690-Pyramimonas_sp.AAC.1